VQLLKDSEYLRMPDGNFCVVCKENLFSLDLPASFLCARTHVPTHTSISMAERILMLVRYINIISW
jgi:hypothetical protein